MANSASGQAGDHPVSDDRNFKSGKPDKQAAQDADYQRVGDQLTYETGHQRDHGFRFSAGAIAFDRPFKKHHRRAHHDRHVNRYDLRQHRQSRFAVKPGHEWNAEQHKV